MPSPVRGAPSEAQTLESLEAITRQSNDVPALLLITPPTTSPSLLPDAEERKPVRRLRISRPASRDAAVDRSQLKELQDSVNEMSAALARQKTAFDNERAALKKALAESQSKSAGLEQQIASLANAKSGATANDDIRKQLLDKSKQVTQLQQQLESAGAKERQESQRLSLALAESRMSVSALQARLDAISIVQDKDRSQMQAESQKRFDELQKQLTVLNAGKTQREQDGKKLQQALAESQKKADDLQKQLTALTAGKTQREQDGKKLQQALAESQKKADELQKQLTVLNADKTQRELDGKKLQQALAESQKKADEQQKQIAELTAARAEKQKEAGALVTELAALKVSQSGKDRDLTEVQDALAESRGKVDALQKQLAAMQQKAATLEAGEPKTAEQIRDYAIGTSLGNDMLAMLKEREGYGIRIGKTQALSGVADAFSGHLKLPQEKISRALYELDVNFNQQEKTLKARMEKQGSQYVAKFSKQPKVKKAPSGFYYRVDYAGQGEIKDTDKVVVVVKESLTDGTVIKDMDVEGTSVSQPLSAYPPLFQAALSQLQNHGSLTMVVPPTLAYGDKGLPPDIPPGATMVYNVRILDILPETAEVGAKR
ncbi:FKBP-type peptidyl-prolyl cis-trans isomerase N-terminal domain-containing protein [Pluralibacter gergoviae]|uniref:FKBP-type peptidyl-prolyl cis-trans isomerase N-terminal domain-containing protein n=2 Tax=Pluralibacter gergoviae TaxID=61647 RepID=UPI0013FDC956|nr:FKBP-type peptidyl-prolyl cis-trans isomerase N-terminal domain-containing protein [Pluralibacter gergoviae]